MEGGPEEETDHGMDQGRWWQGWVIPGGSWERSFCSAICLLCLAQQQIHNKVRWMKEQLIALPSLLVCASWGQGWGSVLVTAVSPTSSVTEPDVEGAGGPTGGWLYVCKIFLWAYLWETVLGFLFRKVEMGDIFGTFHKHLERILTRRRRAPPILESGRWVTLLTATLGSFVFLELPKLIPAYGPSTCYSHSVGTLFSQLLNSCPTLTSVSQPKEHLRKVCIGCPVWDDISQMPLHSHEAMRLVHLYVLRANVIAGSLGLKLYENFFYPALLRYNWQNCNIFKGYNIVI